MRHLGVSLIAVVSALVPAPSPAAADAPPYTVTTLHFRVNTGPQLDQVCDIIGDLYLPRSASTSQRVPAVMGTHGFGGSKDDIAGAGRFFASRGYAFLAYSSLGFGGSTCKVTLNDPAYDGMAARQLVSYLGGADGIAYADAAHQQPAPRLRVIKRDRRNDPRVGMFGFSYGGAAQFAAASVDRRIDALVPMATWNDLSYSMAPNNTGQGKGVSTGLSGATKVTFLSTAMAMGASQGVAHLLEDPERVLGCPNFADWVCPAFTHGATAGFLDPAGVQHFRQSWVASYLKRVRVPVLLIQGEADTIFNLDEATATYRALKKQGTPVKLIWQRFGHNGGPRPGEIDVMAMNERTQHVTQRVLTWFDRHLKGLKVSTGPTFSWFRPWVKYDGIATPAYGTASRLRTGSRTPFFLSGAGKLARSRDDVRPGSASFVTPPLGLPTTVTVPEGVPALMEVPGVSLDLPGTYAQWTSARLSSPLDVVGNPKLAVRLNAPAADSTDPARKLVLFVRVEDVAPNGVASRIEYQVAPIRVADPTKVVRVRLPALVHRFAAGHSVRLVISSGDVNYRGGLELTPVAIASGSEQVLWLPSVE